MNFAPVIVFNYNRPEHSMRTWEALSRNQFASETELYLYCDGPKDGASEEMKRTIVSLHEQARQYAVDAKAAGKFKDAHVVCAEHNKGLANSIIGGVTEVIEKHGRVIVLEDDLLTSPYFLKYMNMALDYYQDYSGVMSISANRPPMSKMQIPADYEYDVFVSLRPFSTGWATWKNEWDKIDWSLDYLEDFLKRPEQIKAFNRGGDDLTDMLCLQRDHKIDSWAIRYAYNHFLHHAVAILPCTPYVDNIGFDGSGIHSGTDAKDYRNDVFLATENPRMPSVVYEDSRIVNAFYNVYCRTKRPIWQKIINRICSEFSFVPFPYKKKIYQ